MTPTPTYRRLSLFVALSLLATAALAQTLARPGWAGSGMNADPWWKHPILYQIDPAGFHTTDATDLQNITKHLDYIQFLNADAILLTPLQTPSNPAPNATQTPATPTPATQTIDPAYGTLDDFDDLIREASRHNMRVIITLELTPATASTDITPLARYWLSRGIAGFYLTGAGAAIPPDIMRTRMSDLRKIMNTYVGQRILIGDLPPSDPSQKSSPPFDRDGPQLLVDSQAATAPQLTASVIRPAMEAAQNLIQSGHTMLLLMTDGPDLKRSLSRYGDGTHDIAIAKVLATTLFSTRAATLLYYGQEIGLTTHPTPDNATADPNTSPALMHWDAPPPPAKGKPAEPQPPTAALNVATEEANPASLLNWYRQLIALHHSNPAITSGTLITLNHDDQNALVWVFKPKAVSAINPAIVMVCNLSAQPVTLSLKTEINKLQIRGSFLRKVLRSNDQMGAMHLESMTLAPYEVYIGEVRF